MLAIIGGNGLAKLPELSIVSRLVVRTPYGDPSCPLTFGKIGKHEVVFLARHGFSHSLAPHEINYRANIWALKQQGVRGIISVGAVASIRSDLEPSSLIVPLDIIDYTHNREHTFFQGFDQQVKHVDFSQPYNPVLRQVLINSARKAKIHVFSDAVYACTQGPRLETEAEVNRIERDGAHVIGMTGMPEAVLAREFDIPYAHLCGVIGWAAGHCPKDGCIANFEPRQEYAAIEQIRQLLTVFMN